MITSIRNALFLVAIYAAALSAAASATPPDTTDTAYQAARLLDPDVAKSEREADFAQLKAQALHGDLFAQYVVGSLYRAGGKLPNNIVERDADAASRYLSNAAAHGYITAMAKMAEIELSAGRGLDAMVWAQTYAHYTQAAEHRDEAHQFANDYLADLLHRISGHFDTATGMSTVADDLNAFITAHDADVRAGIHAISGRYAAAGIHSGKGVHARVALSQRERQEHRTDTLADYIVAFATDGRASQAWLLDAVPDMEAGIDLKSIAMRTEINAASNATQRRYAVIPVQHVASEYTLRSR